MREEMRNEADEGARLRLRRESVVLLSEGSSEPSPGGVAMWS